MIGFCDFCLVEIERPPYFTHLTDRFFIPGDTGTPAFVDSDGEWLVCPLCHELIEARDSKCLYEAWRRSPTRPDANEMRYHQRVVDAFLANYHGSFVVAEA